MALWVRVHVQHLLEKLLKTLKVRVRTKNTSILSILAIWSVSTKKENRYKLLGDKNRELQSFFFKNWKTKANNRVQKTLDKTLACRPSREVIDLSKAGLPMVN